VGSWGNQAAQQAPVIFLEKKEKGLEHRAKAMMIFQVRIGISHEKFSWLLLGVTC